MLKLICGPSGSGKTDLLLKQISSDIQNGIRCFLLVPEQQAYISERDIPQKLPPNAGLYFEIVHFSGLAEDVFRKYGGVTNASISHGIRSLLMWDTLRSTAPLLKQYGKSAKNDGTMTSLMLNTFSELHANGITGERLEEVAELLPLESPLKNKLYDLALIDATYRQKTEEAFGSDPEDRLLRMAQKLQEHDYFENSRVYIDSFTSFTAREFDVLQCIMEQADLVAVSLCADDLYSSLPHFETVKETANRLKKIADQIGLRVEKTKLFPKSAEKNDSLNLIERDLWRFDAPIVPDSNRGGRDTVKLIKCRNVYEEAEAVVLNVLDLVQQGYRYGEIAVVARDIEGYRGILDAAMERYGVPYFLSARTDFSSKPLFRLVLSALRAVYKHYPAQEVLSLLKTGLAGVSLQDCSLFEEYCETWHISGSRFLDMAWSMNPDGLTTEKSERAIEILEAANRARSVVMEPLRLLSDEINASRSVCSKCEALYRYLTRLQISEQLSNRAETELKAGRRREASETVRLYSLLCEILTQICRLLPDAEMSTEEFTTAISLLFGSTDIGSVPNTHDCVTVGSASTMRVEKIRVMLLVGLCEGEFPRAISDDGILTEKEKELLEGYDLSFASRESVRYSEELFYVYRAVTKATERLYLCTVTNEIDGSARSASLAYNRVKLLLGLEEEAFQLRQIRSALSAAESKEGAETETSAIPMPAGSTLRLSQSKIQAFVLCPYRYYSSYRLQLREKKDSAPSYADDGNFLHYVFEKFLLQALCEDGTLSLPDMSEIETIADSVIKGYLSAVCPIDPGEMDGKLLHLYTRLRKLAILILHDMIAELSQSLFVPNGFERVIGASDPNGLPSVSLSLRDGSVVILNGKIDRVDLFQSNERIYVRVVDYKSGEHRFKLEDVASGMDIQLILYLFAVLSSNPHKLAAGAAHFLYADQENGKTSIKRSGIVLEDESVKQALDSTPNKEFTKKLLPQTEEEIKTRIEEMKSAVTSVAERILAGEAKKTPSEDACRYCPVRDNCDKAVK